MNPWPYKAARERELLPKLECLVSASHSTNSTHTPSIGPLPKQESGDRGSVYSPCHSLPESFVTRSSKYFSSAHLQKTQEAVGCGGSPCCPHRGWPPFRTSNKHPEKFPQEKAEAHPCGYEDPCYHGGNIPRSSHQRDYIAANLFLFPWCCVLLCLGSGSVFLSLSLLELLESSGLSPEDYSSSSSREKVGQSKDTEWLRAGVYCVSPCGILTGLGVSFTWVAPAGPTRDPDIHIFCLT